MHIKQLTSYLIFFNFAYMKVLIYFILMRFYKYNGKINNI